MLRILLLVWMVFCAAGAAYGDQPTDGCLVPEQHGYKEYDELVCAGIQSLNQARYQEAIEQFKRAMEIPLFEYPNFKLYSRLALANFKNGDKKKAAELLSKAEISIKIFTRIYHCKSISDDDSSYIIEKLISGTFYRVDSPFHDEIANTMCSSAYDGIYNPEWLDGILDDSEVVKNYIEIRREIVGR